MSRRITKAPKRSVSNFKLLDGPFWITLPAGGLVGAATGILVGGKEGNGFAQTMEFNINRIVAAAQGLFKAYIFNT